MLKAYADLVNGIVDELNYVEHINADMCAGKNYFRDRNETLAHITAKEFHTAALSGRILTKI